MTNLLVESMIYLLPKKSYLIFIEFLFEEYQNRIVK